MQPVVLVDHLPPTHWQCVEYVKKQVRIDFLFISRGRREIEHICRSSLDGLEQSEGASARTALNGGSTHQVSHLVADQRLRAAKQHGEEYFVPLLTGRDRVVVLVHDLEHREILKEMQTLMERAFRCQDATFGGRVSIKDFHLPDLFNAPPYVAR